MCTVLCKKCCTCLPLGYGLILWAYYKLVIAAVLLCVILVPLYESLVMFIYYSIYLTPEEVICSGLFILFLLDTVMSYLFIVCAHKFLNRTRTYKLGTKELKLMRIYFMFNTILWVMAALISVVCGGLIVHVGTMVPWNKFYMAKIVSIAAISFLYLVALTIFLILIRSEMVRPNKTGNFNLMNKADQVLCIAKPDDEYTENNKDTNDIKKGNDVDNNYNTRSYEKSDIPCV